MAMSRPEEGLGSPPGRSIAKKHIVTELSIFLFFFSELFRGKAMVAYTKPNRGRKKKAKG